MTEFSDLVEDNMIEIMDIMESRRTLTKARKQRIINLALEVAQQNEKE